MVSTSSATKVGRVSSFVVDPSAQRVVAVLLKKTPGDADVVLWQALTAVGPDAITVTDSDVFTGKDDAEVSALIGKDHELKRKRVLTEDGEEIGSVEDVEFDAESGIVTALLTGEDSVAGSRLLGVGGYAVVVRRDS
ncbi:MAG: PRC-barrel domain-containing protein [Propionibacteriaceae bacterium]